MEKTLDLCIHLFSHMSDKDLFVELYRVSLSKRLLFNKMVSLDSEKFAVSKMKVLVSNKYLVYLAYSKL